MKKNNKLIILALALIGFFTACQDEYEAPNEFSDVAWYTSMFRQTQFQIGVNNFISFSDLSQNAVSHSWTIAEGAYYLKGPISRNDTVWENFIIKDAPLETTDLTVHVLFTKSGLQPVRLYNTFKEPVTFYGSDTIHAKQVGDIWVIDTTFMVDVFDTIVPQVLVRKEGVEVPMNTDTIYVEAGATLDFVDVTTIGRPNTWEWRVAGEVSTDSAATILFKKLGVFEASLNLSRTGENIPADYDRYIIPNPIKVIPSSKPWELIGDIVEMENQTIQLSFNGEFLPFLNKTEYFKVKLNGADAVIGSLAINSNDKTILDIKLAEPIYKSDVITITLLDGNGINSTDYRTLTPFTDKPVVMYDLNLIQGGNGFEEGSGLWIKGSDDFGTGVNEYSTTNPAKGAYCYHMSVVDDNKRTSAYNPKTFPVVKGKTYELKFKMRVISKGPGGVEVRLNRNGTIDDRYAGNWTGYPAADGNWYEFKKEFTYDDDAPTLGVQLLLYRTIECYFDDVWISEKEVRP